MQSAQDKRMRELSLAVKRLSSSFASKKVEPKPKTLDFLSKRTGLNIPKKKIQPRRVSKSLDFLEKPTGVSTIKIMKENMMEDIIQRLMPHFEALRAELNGNMASLGAQLNTDEPEEEIEVTEDMVREIVKVMRRLPETDRLEVQDIRNAQSFIYGGTKYKTSELMHGGSASGASAVLTPETPSGTVDDSNVTFTVTHTPLYIIVNGAQYTVGTGAFSSYSSGTITLAYPVGTGGFITSFYNA